MAIITPTQTDSVPPYNPAGTYTDVNWPFNPAGYFNFDWHLKPEVDTVDGYFWAHQFFINGSDGAGYAGLQANGTNPNGGAPLKVMVFSYGGSTWGGELGPTFTEGVDGTVGSNFDGASGTTTIVAYEWAAGRAYRIRVWQDGDDGAGHPGWGCWVLDTFTGVETLISHIWVPADWDLLGGPSVCFTERFGPSAPTSCGDIAYASAIFSDFFGDDGAAQPDSLSSHFGANVYCTNSRITDL